MPTLDGTRKFAALQKFYNYVFLRDDKVFYVGDDGNYELVEYDEAGDDILVGPNKVGMWSGCPNLNASNIAQAYCFADDFTEYDAEDAAGRWTSDNDTGTAVLSDNAGGVLVMTAGASSDRWINVVLASAASVAGYPFGIGASAKASKLWFECRVKATAHTNAGCAIGLFGNTNAHEIIADNGAMQARDGVYFRVKEDAATEWDFACIQDGTEAEIDDNVVTNGDDWHTFGFYYDGTTTVAPYINGTAGGTTYETDGSNFPDDELLTIGMCVKDGAGSMAMHVDYVICVQIR